MEISFGVPTIPKCHGWFEVGFLVEFYPYKCQKTHNKSPKSSPRMLMAADLQSVLIEYLKVVKEKRNGVSVAR